MAKSPKRIAKENLKDLLAILAILLKEFVVALSIVILGRVLAWASETLSPHGEWSIGAIKALSDLFSILTFVVLAVKDIWRYSKNR